MAIDKSMLSGSTMLMILSMLEKKDMYGYEMVKELEIKSQKLFILKEGTLYPILHNLEKQGKITSYIGEGNSGRKCKYYKITSNGIKILNQKKIEWKNFSLGVNNVLGVNLYE
ncbi:MAG: PadR family transcriptional regulator [Clostridium sp.]|uniref:PadR family transcriptional regulator n=1 Tax=Clostridium sp. TaxID=1506 RepID=UPI0029158287|nr:PadR family transcriptional regulator [Clostridium sp.]MDU7252095.1 PadR family transcriptional regulator [Clostridium sp.]